LLFSCDVYVTTIVGVTLIVITERLCILSSQFIFIVVVVVGKLVCVIVFHGSCSYLA
jgi:hypothetical protein